MSDDDGRYLPFVVRGIGLDPQSKNPVLLLQDPSERLLLPIWIGVFEAGAIAAALEGHEMPRPMTHDLLARLVEALGAKVLGVDVRALDGGTYLGNLRLEEAGGRSLVVDCRPSDAVALAVRVGAPIRVEAAVLRAAHTLEGDAEGDGPIAVAADDQEALDKLADQLAEMDPEDFGKYRT